VKPLFDYISNKTNISQKAKEYITSISEIKKFDKNTVLIEQGKTVTKMYFVVDGCLRSFSNDKKGKEHTLQFAVKDWWISDFISIYTNGTSTLTLECLMDSTVIEVDTTGMKELYTRFPELEVFQRKNLELHVASLHKRILNQLQLTASERYAVFLNQYPEIEKHALNYHIASYLGITQQSLSRIRSEKAKK
jgi:CRP-like cAMP-binding protein